MTGAPTDRREQILRVVRTWIADHGEGPSIREIGRAVGLSSTSSVAYQLRRMEERGLISRTGRSRHSVRIG
jgi:SOS-response transcriptional repressor LexA